MTRFMVCGLGSIGRRHLRNLQSLGEKDVVLLRTGKSTLPDDDLADLPVERDLDAALKLWRPEAVIVSNPTALHLDVAIPAARAGCHLLIEKPVSHSLAGLEELRSAVRAGGGQVLIGFQFRFHPGLRLAKQMVDGGAIGRPLSMRAHWGEHLADWHPWEDYRGSYAARADLGGGAVLTLCHPFDYLRWILGDVVAVSARTGRLSDLALGVEDVAEAVLEFQSGVLGSVHLDYYQRPACHWMEIVGTLGTVRWDNADGALRSWVSEQDGWAVHPAPAGFERNTMFLDEMRHFIAMVDGTERSRCSLEDGIAALRIALGVRASAVAGSVERLTG
ncbi:MAG: Gfo/Idh/MocA family oxidoreductase [Anaerolineales bacterium]|nr:Gfo/Idh/MocA family oxidoreductase [Anaerolineales bacterium]